MRETIIALAFKAHYIFLEDNQIPREECIECK